MNSTAVNYTLNVESRSVITGSGTTTNYIADGSRIRVTNTIMITDSDDSDEVSGTVKIGAGFQAGDVLSFTNTGQGNITGSYNAGTGVLTLSSAFPNAVLSEWEAALNAVTFSTTSTNTQNRTITFQVTSVHSDSNSVSQTIALSLPIVANVNVTVNGFNGTTTAPTNVGTTIVSGYAITNPPSTPYNLPGQSFIGSGRSIPFSLDPNENVNLSVGAGVSVTLQAMLPLTNAAGLTTIPSNYNSPYNSINTPVPLTSTLVNTALNEIGASTTTSNIRYLVASDFKANTTSSATMML
ncbi:MAG: hypothetical protein EB015_11385 [Methylocystaceae bacterium]|nr:hypothetical protein [Methylocystaceae bacterium]